MSEPTSGDASVDAPGKLVVVVGPSGAGKDSLIARAKQELSGNRSVLFVRRVVTRSVSSTEDHACMSQSEFAAACKSGQFAVHWKAHGLSYGVPAAVRVHLSAGGVAVLNGSRAALPDIRAAFDRVTVIHVTAHPAIVAERLKSRGRESGADIVRRLQRSEIELPRCGHWVDIDNSGPFETSAALFLHTINQVLNET